MKRLPPLDELRSSFSVDDTGTLFWKWREGVPRNINGRLAGKPAGAVDSSGYVHVVMSRKFYQAHRIVWALAHGKDPYPQLLDHVNGNRRDNRPDNLRVATPALNVVNGKPRGRLGLKGVYEFRPGVFVAQTKYKGTTKYLGSYSTAEEAHEVYCLAVDLLHGRGAYARVS